MLLSGFECGGSNENTYCLEMVFGHLDYLVFVLAVLLSMVLLVIRCAVAL